MADAREFVIDLAELALPTSVELRELLAVSLLLKTMGKRRSWRQPTKWMPYSGEARNSAKSATKL